MEVPTISTPVLGFFRGIVRRYLKRHFHAVRSSGMEHVVHLGGPLIVYGNHSSWWDPMVAFLLAKRLFPARRHYAPMDAVALERYAILKRVGIFPVEMHSPRGAAQFLRTGRAIVSSGGVLWVTPQGRFADPRERPLEFKPGLSALVARVTSELGPCTLLPLAIEYTFWDQRLPECLLHFGEPVRVAAGEHAPQIDARLRAALLNTMDSLKDLATRRDPAAFATMLEGTSGTGGLYAFGQRLKALILRREYHPEHAGAPAKATIPGGSKG